MIDNFVIDFIKLIENSKMRYVIVSGYVSLLFGRTRTTEDVDMFIEKISFDNFKKIIEMLEKHNYWILNGDVNEAFGMLDDGLGIRIAKKGKNIPNFEIKFVKKDLDVYSLKNRVRVVLNNNIIYISPIEIQIAYKLFLNTPKDFEDSRYVYKLFKENIDLSELRDLIKKLKKENAAKKILPDLYED